METIKGVSDAEKRRNVNKDPNDSIETADAIEADEELKIKGMGRDGNEEKAGLETVSMPLRQIKEERLNTFKHKYGGKGYVLENNPQILDTQTIGLDKITETGELLIRKTRNLPPGDEQIVTTTVSKVIDEECSCTQESPELPPGNIDQISRETKMTDDTTDPEMVNILSEENDVSKTECLSDSEVYCYNETVDTVTTANQKVSVENQDNSHSRSHNIEEPNKEINVRQMKNNEQGVEYHSGTNENGVEIVPCLNSFNAETRIELLDEDINSGLKINKDYCHIGKTNKIKDHLINDVMMVNGLTVVDKETEVCDGYMSCETQPEKVTANNINVHDTDIKMSEPYGTDAIDKMSEANVEKRPTGTIPDENLQSGRTLTKVQLVNDLTSNKKVEEIRISDQLTKKELTNSLTSTSKVTDQLLETEGQSNDKSREYESVRSVTEMNHVTEQEGDILQELEDGEIVEETENDVRLKETDQRNIRRLQADKTSPTERDLRFKLGRKAYESSHESSFQTNHKGKSSSTKPPKGLGNVSKKSKIGHKNKSYYDWGARPVVQKEDKIGKYTENQREDINNGDICIVEIDLVGEDDEQELTRAIENDEVVGEQKEICKEDSVVEDTRICKLKNVSNDDLRKVIDDRKKKTNEQIRSARQNAVEYVLAKSHRKRTHSSNERHSKNHKRVKAVHDKHFPKTDNRSPYEQDRSNMHKSLSRSKQNANKRTLENSKNDNHFNKKPDINCNKQASKPSIWEHSTRVEASNYTEKILSDCRYKNYKNSHKKGTRENPVNLNVHRETRCGGKASREAGYASSERNKDLATLRSRGRRTDQGDYSMEPDRDVPYLSSGGRRIEHREYLVEPEKYKDTMTPVGKMSSSRDSERRLCPKESSQSTLMKDSKNVSYNKFRQRHEESYTYMMTDKEKYPKTRETMSPSYENHRRSPSQYRKRYLDQENETETSYYYCNHAHKQLRENDRNSYSHFSADRKSQPKSEDFQNARERIYFGDYKSDEDVRTRDGNIYNFNTHDERAIYSHMTDNRWDSEGTKYENGSEQRRDRRAVQRDTKTRLFENGEPVTRDQRSFLSETRSEMFENGEMNLRDLRTDPTKTITGLCENGRSFDQRTVSRETRAGLFNKSEASFRESNTYDGDELDRVSSNGSHGKRLRSPSSIYESDSTPDRSLYPLSPDFQTSSRDLREEFQNIHSNDRSTERKGNGKRNNTNYQVTTQPPRVSTGMFGDNALVSLQVQSFPNTAGVSRVKQESQTYFQAPCDDAEPSQAREYSQLLTSKYLQDQTKEFRSDIIIQIHRALVNKKLNNLSSAAARSTLGRLRINFGTEDTLLYLIKQFDDKFIVRHVFGQDLISVKSDIKICSEYTKNQKKKHPCSDLHICKYYILSQCNSRNCKFGHDLKTEQNTKALQMKGLDGIDASSVKFVMQNVDSRNVSTTPLVCKFYNNKGGCKQERACTFLHLCLHFLTEDCKFANCTRSHDFRDEQPLAVLQRHGIQPDIIDDVKIKELIKETLSEDRIKLKRDLMTTAENGTAGRDLYKCASISKIGYAVSDGKKDSIDPEQTSGDSVDSAESIDSSRSSSEELAFIPLNSSAYRYGKRSKRS